MEEFAKKRATVGNVDQLVSLESLPQIWEKG